MVGYMSHYHNIALERPFKLGDGLSDVEMSLLRYSRVYVVPA